MSVSNNLAVNPSFENALVNPDGSGFYDNGGTVALVTDDPKATGTNCVSITATNNALGGACFEAMRPYVSAYSPNGVVVMGGTRPILDGVSIVNTDSAEADAAHGWNGILVVSGDGAYVRPHALRNLYVGVVVRSGVTNAVVDFSGTQFLTADSGQLLSDSSGGGAHIINPRSLS